MKKVIIYCLFIVMTAVMCSGCAETGQTKVTVVLDWTPNTNHTGLYVALHEGYFEKEGLDVEIIQPSEGTAEQLVASGAAHFGVSYQENVTFSRAEGIPIVSLAAVIQHNTSGFASLKEKGIVSVKDFEGKKYGGWGSPIEEATIQYLMEMEGADPEKVEILTTGEADFFQASATDEIDFAWIFEAWTGIEAKLKDMELNYIDLGKEAEVFDYYTPVLITREKNIQENHELVASFVRAVEKGYQYAIDNPEEAADILLELVPELDRDLVVESQKYLAGKYCDDAPYWGMQKAEVWERYMLWLHENGFITEPVDSSKAFTNDFLNGK